MKVSERTITEYPVSGLAAAFYEDNRVQTYPVIALNVVEYENEVGFKFIVRHPVIAHAEGVDDVGDTCVNYLGIFAYTEWGTPKTERALAYAIQSIIEDGSSWMQFVRSDFVAGMESEPPTTDDTCTVAAAGCTDVPLVSGGPCDNCLHELGHGG